MPHHRPRRCASWIYFYSKFYVCLSPVFLLSNKAGEARRGARRLHSQLANVTFGHSERASSRRLPPRASARARYSSTAGVTRRGVPVERLERWMQADDSDRGDPTTGPA